LIKWHFCSKTVQKISLPQAESIHLMRTTGEAAFEIYWERCACKLDNILPGIGCSWGYYLWD
jgi:hypothetical protein